MSRGFLLDTNVPSEFTKPIPEPRVVRWVSLQNDLYLSVISVGELRKGFSLLSEGRRRRELEKWFDESLAVMVAQRILPVTEAIGRRWGLMSAARQLSARPLGMADGLIAATALESNLTVVTRNVADFADLGITLVNPWD